MNVNVYIETSIAKQLDKVTYQMGKPRNAIIREAIKEWLENHETKKWPKSILDFQGLPNMPRFESSRKDLLDPSEDPLL